MHFTVNLLSAGPILIAALQLAFSIMSLFGGIRFYRYVVASLESKRKEFDEPVSVFVPCRGIEHGLDANLKMILKQDYKDFEIIFIVDNEEDPAVSVIDRLTDGYENTRLVNAGPATDSGQKVHNLMAGVEAARPESKAFVFVDSDARPTSRWLLDLLSPLSNKHNGASTGYRWFVQETGGVGTHLRSAWNASIASSLGPNTDSNFCWGGSTAIRRSVFEELNVVKHWRGTVSDDFVLTKLIAESSYKIHFEPKCLTATLGNCSMRELLEFSNRQMKITKTYSKQHFLVSLIGASLLSLTFIAGVISLFLFEGLWWGIMAAELASIWLLGTAKTIFRIYTVRKCLPQYEKPLDAQYLPQVILWPLSTFLFFCNDINALSSNLITWRGITYELVSDKDIRIIK